MSDIEIATLVDLVRSKMENMAIGERVRLIDDIMSGYCTECGAETHGRRCKCKDRGHPWD